MKNQASYLSLNNFSKSNSLDDIIKFYDINHSTLFDILKSICPFSKIILVFDKDSFNTYSSYTKSLSNEGFNVVSIIEDDFLVSVENCGKLMSVSEDVRCVVCFTAKAFDLVSYFASLNQLNVIYYIDSLDICSSLKNRTFIINGNNLDYIKLSYKRHIVFDTEKICLNRKNQAALYINILSRLISLIDYRIGGLADVNDLNSFVYDTLRQAVLKTYLVYSKNYEEQPMYLVENFYLAEMANILSNGELCDFSSPFLTSYIFKDYNICSSIKLLAKLLGIYAITFNIQGQNTLDIRNYFCDLIDIKNLTSLDVKDVYNTIKNNSNIYYRNETKFIKLMKSLKEEVDLLNRSVKTIKQTYHTLLGEDNVNEEKLNDCLRYSGCIFNCFNGMTLVKETGILD